MNKNKIIILLASTLTTATLVTLPIVAMVNNVSSNANLVTNNDVNEVIGSEDFEDSDYSASEISEQENSDFNNELISEINNEINNEINVNLNNEQAATHSFDVYQNDLISAGWGNITTKGTHLTFEVISDGGTDDTREARIIKPQTTFKAENFSIQSTVYDAKANKTYKVVEVAASAFEYPSSAATLSGSLTIGDNIKVIGNRAFYDQSNITSLDLGSSILSIGDKAFCECEKISGNLIIPDSVLTIGASAFSYCKGFNGNLIIGDGVKTIGDYAFDKCTGFNGNLTIGSGVKLIPDSLFKNHNFAGTLIIKSGVESIGRASFFNCKFSSIIIEDGLKNICESAFANNNYLTGELVIPNSVTTIDKGAFQNCGNAARKSIILTIKGPENNELITIKGNAFADCNLTDINFEKNIALDYEYAYEELHYKEDKFHKTEVDYPFAGCHLSHVKYFCTKPPVIPNPIYLTNYSGFDPATAENGYVQTIIKVPGTIIINSLCPSAHSYGSLVSPDWEIRQAFDQALPIASYSSEVHAEMHGIARLKSQTYTFFSSKSFIYDWRGSTYYNISYPKLDKIDSLHNSSIVFDPFIKNISLPDEYMKKMIWSIDYSSCSSDKLLNCLRINALTAQLTLSPGLPINYYSFKVLGSVDGILIIDRTIEFSVCEVVTGISIDMPESFDVVYQMNNVQKLTATIDNPSAFNKKLKWEVNCDDPSIEKCFYTFSNDLDGDCLNVGPSLPFGKHTITIKATTTDGSNISDEKSIVVNTQYVQPTEITIVGDNQINVLSNNTKQVSYQAKTLRPGNATPNPEAKWSVTDKNSKGITIDPNNGVLDIPVISEVGVYPIAIHATCNETVTASLFVNINVYGNNATDLTIVGDKIISDPAGIDTTYEYEIQSNPSGGNALATWAVVDINTRDPIDGITIEPKNEGSHAILKIDSTVVPSDYQMQIIATPKAGHQISRPMLDIDLNVQNIVPAEIKIDGPQQVNSTFSVGSSVNYTATINDGATPGLEWELDQTYPGIKLEQTAQGSTLKIDDSIQNDTKINIIVSSTVGDKKQIYPVDIKINYAPAQSIDIKGQSKITHIYGGDQTTVDFDAIVYTNDSEILTNQEVIWTIETTHPDKIEIDENGKILIDSNLPKGIYDIKITAISVLTPEIFETKKVTIVSNYANTETIEIISQNAITATIGQANIFEFQAKTSSTKGITDQQVYWEMDRDTLIEGISIDFLTGELNVDTGILNKPQDIKITIIAKALQPDGQYITQEQEVTISIISIIDQKKNPINLGAIIGGTIGGVVGVGAITGGSIYAVKYSKLAKAKK